MSGPRCSCPPDEPLPVVDEGELICALCALPAREPATIVEASAQLGARGRELRRALVAALPARLRKLLARG